MTEEAIRRVDYWRGVEVLLGGADKSLEADPSVFAADTNEAAFYWDVDGYVDPFRDSKTFKDPSDGLLITGSEVSILHYLLRSSLVLGVNATPEDFSSYQEFSKLCCINALSTAGGSGWRGRPVWIDDFTEKLNAAHPEFMAQIAEVHVLNVVRPQILAFSYPAARTIEISAVAREHLRTVDLLLWTVAAQILNPETREGATHLGEALIDTLLPWLLALYFPDVNYSRLPILRTPDGATLRSASHVARIQVEFMLAHEFGHMLEHGGQPPSPELEREADEFAYRLLLETSVFQEQALPYMTFLSLRWLFLYLSLDRIVGAVLSGYQLDWVNLPIRDRDFPLLSRIGLFKASLPLQSIASMGDLLLFQAKAAMYRRGVDWLRRSADQFHEEFCRP